MSTDFIGQRSQTTLKIFFAFFTFSLVMRFVFWFFFNSSTQEYSTEQLLHSIYLGSKFDLRVSIALCLPFAIFSFFLNPFKKASFNKFWLHFYSFTFFAVVLIYFLDIGYYSYLKDRINATALDFLKTPLISFEMMWQSYPLTWIGLLALALFLAFRQFLKKYIFNFNTRRIPDKRNFYIKSSIRALTAILIVLGLYGKLAYYPLRWSEAFFSSNRFISSFSLNPIHYFFDTLTNREKDYDRKLVQKYYDRMVKYLGVDSPDKENLNFKRLQKPTPIAPFSQPPNVIVIIMESLSAHRTGAFGNPLGATPATDELARDGWLFTNFYTPSEGTARGVFATITGLADINKGRTSSRNPLIVDQNTAANSFADYDRYYFIGGSANWGNIRGILTSNIYGLDLYEEGRFTTPRTDVWGLSDYHLFLESHKILSERKNKKPFLAFIQSSGFHRPYTIPEDRNGFEFSHWSEEEVQKWGFESLKELNALKFADFSLKNFIDLAKKSTFFENTLFVLLGDHGLPDNSAHNLTPSMIKHSTERFHTPFILYSPKYLKPKKISSVMSQVDVLPTLAAATGHSFVNTGLGRNILDPKFAEEQFAMSYVYYRTPHQIFLLSEDYLVTGNPEEVSSLYHYRDPQSAKDIGQDHNELLNDMSFLANAIYQTSKFMLYNNPKQK